MNKDFINKSFNQKIKTFGFKILQNSLNCLRKLKDHFYLPEHSIEKIFVGVHWNDGNLIWDDTESNFHGTEHRTENENYVITFTKDGEYKSVDLSTKLPFVCLNNPFNVAWDQFKSY